MKRYLTYIIIIFSLSLNSCVEKGLIDPDIVEFTSQNDNVLIPLAIGNYWDYKITEIILDINNNILNKQFKNIKESISSKSKIEDVNWYKIESDYTEESISIRNFKDGVHYYLETNQLVFKNVVDVGNKYLINAMEQTITFLEDNEIKTLTARVSEFVELIEIERNFQFEDKLLKVRVYKTYFDSDNDEFNKHIDLKFPIKETYIAKDIGILKEIHYKEYDDKKSNAIFFIKELTNYYKVVSNDKIN